MGKRGKRRRAKERLRQQQSRDSLSTTTETGNNNKRDPWPPVLRWWWAVLATIFLGVGCSLLLVYFLPSVILIYAGIAVLLVGLWFEPWKLVFRLACMLIIMGAVAAFTFGVVLKPAPLIVRAQIVDGAYPPGTSIGGIHWNPSLRDLRVQFENDTGEDYEQADFHVQIDANILGKGQVGNLPGLTFEENELQARRTLVGEDGGKIVVPLPVLQNHYRLRCDKIPRYNSLEVTFAVALSDLPKITSVRVEGQYRGNMRIRKVKTAVSVR